MRSPSTNARVYIILSAFLLFAAAGCTKKPIAKSTPPAPEPAATTATSTPRQTPVSQPIAQSAPRETASNAPANSYPSAATRARIDELLARISDAYFDYNQRTLRPDAINALQTDSSELRDIISQYPNYKLTIEGHCDERGSEAYNLALGDARAEAAKNYLVKVGISNNQLAVISYGKDKPTCEEHDEACWQKNRRIHIVASAN